MRVLLQRVTGASVTAVDEEEREIGRIGPGALALVAFAPGDDGEILAWMAAKIADVRIFPSEGGEFERSLRDTGGGLLVVSQFTLYGDARKGRRPDFGSAAPYADAEELYDRFLEACRTDLPGKVASGEFGARMRISLVNDGPVTLWLER